ncbi:MAG: class I SAM-dependent methyltransferase [Bacteroidales bacterium]|nr:class I SAM-dependent methyltransferase [Bacteroidales bacterium]
MTLDERTWQFVMAHSSDDVARLALQPVPEGVDLHFALQQIKGRQKAQEKLSDFYACERVLYPPTVNMEQCSSTVTAQYKTSLIDGDTFADLSGGFGVDTMHLARRFKSGYYVEPDESLAQIVAHNMDVMGVKNVTIVTETMEQALTHLEQVDWLYVDPSRRDEHGQRVVDLSQCVPNIIENKSLLNEKARKGIMVKLSPMLDLREALRQLPETTCVQVVAVGNECKELLFILDKISHPLMITAANLNGSDSEVFTFSQEEEAQSIPTWAEKVSAYLYEPNVAIMKAGAYKSLSCRYPVQKLGSSTHLYTSEECVADFPGRILKVIKTMPFNKREIREVSKEWGRANVAVRNFPLSADDLHHRLGVRDGGDIFLYGTTIGKNEKILVVCEKICDYTPK